MQNKTCRFFVRCGSLTPDLTDMALLTLVFRLLAGGVEIMILLSLMKLCFFLGTFDISCRLFPILNGASFVGATAKGLPLLGDVGVEVVSLELPVIALIGCDSVLKWC